MTGHTCPCCQVYGPIDREPDLETLRKNIRKEAEANIERLKKEDPKAYEELVEAMKKLSI